MRNNKIATVEHVHDAREALKKNGVYLIDQAYDENYCEKIINFIDSQKEDSNVEINYSGTEKRIWQSHKIYPLIKDFANDSGEFLSSVFGKKFEPSDVLAYKNTALDNSDQNSRKGRWHIDSFRRMYKIFIFLTDTTELSGPFEYLPNTHKTSFRYKMALKQNFFFDFTKLLSGGKRPYQSISDDKIGKLVEHGYQPTPVIVRAGTVMVVDTSSIHRARPCIVGNRYALTAYFGKY